MADVEIGGTYYFVLNGKTYSARASGKISIGGAEQDPVMGADGALHGYISKYHAPTHELEISDQPGLSLVALQGLNAATSELQLGNGKVYSLSNCFLTNVIDLDITEGKFMLKFAGILTERMS